MKKRNRNRARDDALSADNRRAITEALLAIATRRYCGWLPHEDKAVMSDAPLKVTAARLGRTLPACRARRTKLQREARREVAA